jgi:hypothetical protein
MKEYYVVIRDAPDGCHVLGPPLTGLGSRVWYRLPPDKSTAYLLTTNRRLAATTAKEVGGRVLTLRTAGLDGRGGVDGSPQKRACP